MATSRTRTGTRKLSEVARHVVQPDGIISTGYPAVEAKCRDLGIVHDDWQQGLGRLILGKRKDGKYAATIGGVVLSIPRQVGKTFTIGSILFALCILFPGLMVLWTSHRTRTSNESFRSMQGMARRKRIAPHVSYVRSTNGEQEIGFHNGSRILFGAREQGFGRGFAQVDVEVFDEAQILSERALEDMVAATNQARHPSGALLFYMGTPPRPSDPGDAFRAKRAKALSGTSKDMVYVELSADVGCDPDDRAQWRKANPSYPGRTPSESMLRLRENVGSIESFLREGLGIWDEGGNATAFSAATWAGLAGSTPERGSDVVFALDVAPDHSTATIAAGWALPGALKWLQLADHRPGVEWVVARAEELRDSWDGRLLVEQTGTAAFLLPKLTWAEPVSRRFYADACSTLDADVSSSTLRHGNQPELNAAVAVARWSTSGEAGQRVLSRKDPRVSPVVASALALHALASTPRRGGWMVGV